MVKNVSGYDIPKLHVGALGTLGVVVEAHLRLHSRPAEERSWAFGFASAEAALDAALEARDTSVVLSRCQILTAGALRALGESEPPGAALAVTIGSVPEAVRAQGARLADICGRSGSAAIEVPDADAWWRPDRRDHVAGGSGGHLSLRIGTRPSDVVRRCGRSRPPALGRARSWPRSTWRRGCSTRPSRPSRASRDAATSWRASASRSPRSTGAVSSSTRRPGACRRLDVWGDVGPAIEPMRRLKRELDPAGVLNPGRYVGGI